MVRSVEELYGELWGPDEAEIEAELKQSLHPRPAEMLYDVFAGLGVQPGDTILDVGCRDAKHAVELVRRFGGRVVGIDPVSHHLERAHARLAEAGLSDRISVHQAGIEAIPLDDASVDHIWCRDVLVHVDLPRGLAECHRVLRPGGAMLIYQTFGTELIEPNEARRLYAAMAIVPRNMEPAYFEATAHANGFTIERRDPIDSEWRENWAEHGDTDLLDALLVVARLRRAGPRLRARFGDARVETATADHLWGIYQLLGKLCPTVYVLRRA